MPVRKPRSTPPAGRSAAAGVSHDHEPDELKVSPESGNLQSGFFDDLHNLVADTRLFGYENRLCRNSVGSVSAAGLDDNDRLLRPGEPFRNLIVITR